MIAPIVRLCVDCLHTFQIGQTEQRRIARKNYGLPRRCRDCRALRQNEPPETRDQVAQAGRLRNGWES